MMKMVTPRPQLSGIENVPRQGGVLLVANHYTRPGMWIGWPGALLADALHAHRGPPTVRIVVTDAQRNIAFGQRYQMPLSGFFLGRVARLWNMIRISGDPHNVSQRATALKQVLRALKDGDSILFFPEGDRGSADHPLPPLPGTGTLIALAARICPVCPVSFWEDGNALHGRIGPPLTLISKDDQAVRDHVATAIKAQCIELP